jgi:hypothetical protein
MRTARALASILAWSGASLLITPSADDRPAPFDGAPAAAQGRVAVHGDVAYFTSRAGDDWRIETRRRAGREWRAGEVLRTSRSPVAVMSPAIDAATGRLVFESSLREPSIAGREDTDVWVMERAGGGWGAARPLGPPFDSPYNEHAPTVDGAGTICFNSGRPDGLGGNDIYCGRVDATPSLIRAVSSPAQDAGPWLADGGRVLLFTSNRPGGEGGWDLYVSTRTATGWQAPQNLGARINTPADELWPTWSDGRLYFKRTGGTEPPGYFSVTLPLPR